jgi:hypothetical protein
MAGSGYGLWAIRLEQACAALHLEARWLTADVGGPFEMVGRMAASDVWGGSFADQLRGAVRYLDGQVFAWGEHLGRLHSGLEQAAEEAAQAARMESVGDRPGFRSSRGDGAVAAMAGAVADVAIGSVVERFAIGELRVGRP